MEFDTPTIAIIVATFFGPIAAVQAQKYLERSREKRDRKLYIFRTLMITRATPVAQNHVEALNAIPIEFLENKRKERPIIDKWRKYISFLDTPAPEDDSWRNTRVRLFTELLQSISDYLDFKMTYDDLIKHYYPAGHQHLENDNAAIRNGLATLFKGELCLPVSIRSFPSEQHTITKTATLSECVHHAQEAERIAFAAPTASIEVDDKTT